MSHESRAVLLGVAFLSLAGLSGCAVGLGGAGDGGRAARPASEAGEIESEARLRLRPLAGLDRVVVPVPGVLEIRTDHRIAGYDEILLRDARLAYRPGSLELTRDAEVAFLDLLESSLVRAIESSRVPLATERGRCAMEVELEVADMDLETADYSPQLVGMVIAMTFRDSVSGDPLLRYARAFRIDQPAPGNTDDRQLRVGLQEAVREMNVATVLRPAGLATDSRIDGCAGTLGERGRAANAAIAVDE